MSLVSRMKTENTSEGELRINFGNEANRDQVEHASLNKIPSKTKGDIMLCPPPSTHGIIYHKFAALANKLLT